MPEKTKTKAEVGTCPVCGSHSVYYGRDEYDVCDGSYFKRLQLCANKDCRKAFWDNFTMKYTGQTVYPEPADMDEYNSYVDENGDAR